MHTFAVTNLIFKIIKMEVKYTQVNQNKDLDLYSVFEKTEKHYINCSSWGKVEFQPEVYFKISHTNKSILLQYDVREVETRAVYSIHNEPISKDSCVEFFIEFENDKKYFNLEFNCLGTCRAAWGSGRYGREFLSKEAINRILIETKINRSKKDKMPIINWQLTIEIPVEIFANSKISQLSGKKARANFYKCGDKLKNPHFLSWKKIETPEPDFHQPDFFKEITFL